jgi:hypothetical protein
MGGFPTGEAARDRYRAALDSIDAAHQILRDTPTDLVGNDFRIEVAERLETQERTNRGLMYRMFGEIADPPDETGFIPALRDKLWARLHITPKEITRRMRQAARIRPRRNLTGPPCPPELPLLAQAVEAGQVGEDHIRAVCQALNMLPSAVSDADRGDAERSLVEHATKFDAGIVTAAGRRLSDYLNPDGQYDEADRARRRWLRMSPQGPDGMSRFNGVLDPQARAYFEAIIAAVRPGHRTPEGHDPALPDDRTPGQRCHDAFKLGMKTAIASGNLGTHRGLPVTVIATTTLAELNQAAHATTNPAIPMPPPALTGGGSALPMRDVIKMAAEAIHYLAVFDDHRERPLYLGRQKRLATADQRIICYARDRGCTHPGCLEPGYHCEVHHGVTDWVHGGHTNADELFFACDPDHDLVNNGYKTTQVTNNGRLGWTDGTSPPEINHAHHPDELLRGDPDPPDNES